MVLNNIMNMLWSFLTYPQQCHNHGYRHQKPYIFLYPFKSGISSSNSIKFHCGKKQFLLLHIKVILSSMLLSAHTRNTSRGCERNSREGTGLLPGRATIWRPRMQPHNKRRAPIFRSTDLQAASPSTLPFQTVQQCLPDPASTKTLTMTCRTTALCSCRVVVATDPMLMFSSHPSSKIHTRRKPLRASA